jgi:alpha-beta hydrolase superfamily lysophospholipase
MPTHNLSLSLSTSFPRLTSLSLSPLQGVGWVTKGVLRLLSVVTPCYQIDVGLDSTHLTNDPAKQEENDHDPLVHSLATPSLFNDWWEILHYVANHPDRVRLPFLMMQGAADKIVVPRENRRFFDEVARTNAHTQFCLLPDGTRMLYYALLTDVLTA